MTTLPEVITSEHLASKIRSANDSAENPPNYKIQKCREYEHKFASCYILLLYI